MSYSTERGSRPGSLERHVQSIIQALILLTLAWSGKTLIDVRESTAETKTSLIEMKSRIETMNQRFEYYIPRAEADARFGAEDSKHVDIERRLNSIEARGSH